jgi:hypothetical protein
MITMMSKGGRESHRVLSLLSYLPYGRVNLGDGRYIPRPHIDRVKIHRSVKIRMNADCLEDGKYKPEAKLGSEEPEWID